MRLLAGTAALAAVHAVLGPVLPAGPSSTPSSTPAVTSAGTVVDHFERSVSGGLGTADSQDTWSTATSAASASVSGGAAQLALSRGGSVAAELPSVSTTTSDTTVALHLTAPTDAGSTYVSVLGRNVRGAGDYRVKLRFLQGGGVAASLVASSPSGDRTLSSGTVPGSYQAGQPVHVRLAVSGTNPTTVQARTWLGSAADPGAWALSVQDSGSGLQTAGDLGLQAYLSSSSQSGSQTVAVDDLSSQVSAAAAAPPRTGGRPNAGNTGVPAGTTLKRYDGDLTITTAGAHYDALDVHGFVTIKAPNVTISRSIIRGGYGKSGTDQGLVTDYGYPGFVISDSELVPEHPSVALDAIKGWDFTASRINAHGTVDGAKIHGNDVTVQASWIHDLVTYASDPFQNGGQSHNDGVQILGGDNVNITGNDVSGGSNTALLITQDSAYVTHATISGNWFDGGNQSVGLMAKPRPQLSGLTLTNNRFGHHTRYKDCAVLTWGTVTMTASGNVYDDTGDPIRIHPA